MKVLVIGSGGREHALCWKIAQSTLLTKLWCLPGNPGISKIATCVPGIATINVDGIVKFAIDNKIDLVVPGPEAPLIAGLADALEAVSIRCCGPCKDAAMLEGSKSFMKTICAQANIPTAASQNFHDHHAAIAYLASRSYPIVIKADGLAAGKGVVIAHSRADAETVITDMLLRSVHGDAGKVILIEDFLDGEELSFFVLCDGTERCISFGTAKDFKKALDGDKGLNTGGMGSLSPSPFFYHRSKAQLHSDIMTTIIHPTLQAMRERGTPYKGILFAGIMVQKREGHLYPKLLEYNVRYGDPESQSILVRMESDVLKLLNKASQGALGAATVKWNDQYATTVVMASPGYPESPITGSKITINAKQFPDKALAFHSGTMMDDGDLIAAGGRVLSITATGDDRIAASDTVYAAVDKVDWPEAIYRLDIE